MAKRVGNILYIIGVFMLAIISAVNIKVFAAEIKSDELWYEFQETFDELPENRQFEKQTENNIYNSYGRIRLHVWENDSEIRENKNGKYLNIENSTGALDLSQIYVDKAAVTGDKVLMEQDICIDDLSAAEIYYLGYNMMNTDFLTAAVLNDGTLKLGEYATDLEIKEKKWYNFKLYVDINKNTADLEVDDVLAAENIPLQKDIPDSEEIYAGKYTYFTGGRIFDGIRSIGIDNIKIANIVKNDLPLKYNVKYGFSETFDELPENRQFEKQTENNIYNSYGRIRLHVWENDSEIRENKNGKYLNIENSTGALDLSQIYVDKAAVTGDKVLMEQDICIDDLSAAEIYYLGYNMMNTDFLTAAVLNDGTLKLGEYATDLEIKEKKWYNFKLYVDINKNTADLEVDDVLAAENIPLQKDIPDSEEIYAGKYTYFTGGRIYDGTRSICIDNIRIANVVLNRTLKSIAAEIVNEYGIEINNTSDAETEINGKFNVYNNDSQEKSAYVILALYCNGTLEKVKMDKVLIEPYKKKTVNMLISKDEIKNGFGDYIAKAFLWEDDFYPVLMKKSNDKTDYPLQLYIGETTGVSRDFIFQTVSEAQEYIRNLKTCGKYPKNGINVNIRGGRYYFQRSLSFDENESGKPEAPVVYRAYKDENVILSGAKKIDKNIFVKLSEDEKQKFQSSAADKIYKCDLPANGIGKDKLGELEYIGVAVDNSLSKYNDVIKHMSAKLYVDGNEMTLARWPNNSYALTEAADGDFGSSLAFKIPNEKAEKWCENIDGRIFGFFENDWYDESDRIKNIDKVNGILTLEHDRNFKAISGKRYYVYNIPYEIDSPGEYYIDRETGVLYFYMPEECSDISISLFDNSFIDIRNASYLQFENLSLECGRDSGLEIFNSNNIRIQSCIISNMKSNGIRARQSQTITVRGCDISNIGKYAVIVDGGNLYTLSASGNVVENNKIHAWGKEYKCYSVAVRASGVGAEIIHNKMFGAPHAAITMYGNDHYVGYNEIYDVLKETDDAGAIYIGKSWIQRGITVANNYIHDIKSTCSEGNLHGVYFDDFFCGGTVTKNVFEDICGNYASAFKGGGRDTAVTNNIVIRGNALYRGILLKYGYLQQYGSLDKYKEYLREIWESTEGYGLNSAQYNKDVYSKYPHIGDYDENDLVNTIDFKYSTMKNNFLYNVKCDRFWTHSGNYPQSETEAASGWSFTDSYSTSNNPGFVDVLNKNYNIKNNNTIQKNNREFDDVEFYKMGLYWE